MLVTLCEVLVNFYSLPLFILNELSGMRRILYLTAFLLVTTASHAQQQQDIIGEWTIQNITGIPAEPSAVIKKTVDALLKSQFRFDKDGRFTLMAPEKNMAINASNWKYDAGTKTIIIDQADMSGDFVVVMKILVKQESGKWMFLPDIYPYELEMKKRVNN